MDQTQLESLLAGSGEVDGDSIQDETLREAMLKAMPAIIDASTNLSGIKNPKPDGTLLESVSLSKLIPSPILATTTGGTTPISSISSYALPCKF
ncbi:unnamed protein product [Protopolystoma xenopodis]|uniref:Uncharacterized protein n=1 Tax=Protopolystoma xenopodis TaxID=117903 RepID=A0A3S5AAA4_9PLAT|nr:unnamed protein product [Protopolystoma xenopodis]